MATKTSTLKQYLANLAPDRRKTIQALREVINKNIDKKFEEGMQYGMPSWYLPHSIYPAGYHCKPSEPLPFAGIASQKNHIGLHLFCVYADETESKRFQEEWLATGKKLDMGKSCVRVKKLEDVPLPVIGRVFKRMTAKKFVAAYEGSLTAYATSKANKKKSSKKAAERKMTSKKATR
jgi:hypothetical protein